MLVKNSFQLSVQQGNNIYVPVTILFDGDDQILQH